VKGGEICTVPSGGNWAFNESISGGLAAPSRVKSAMALAPEIPRDWRS
jgi:hypothetical protein